MIKCLIVEGNEKSFDAVFYPWVIDIPTLVIEPLGGSNEVVNASHGTGVWERIAPNSKIVGLIDRDFKSDEELDAVSTDRVCVLDYHEAESYLCNPKLIHDLATAIGSLEAVASEDEIADKILEMANGSLLYVIAQRVSRRLAIPLRPSLLRSEAKSLTDKAEMLSRIQARCVEEKNKATSKFDEKEVETVFEAELNRCQALVDSKDVDGMLLVFEGKEMLGQLHKFAACPNPEAVARAAGHLLNMNDYPHLVRLRDTLSSTFSHNDS